jgi:7-cyano-7-deazaguanine reductase
MPGREDLQNLSLLGKSENRLPNSPDEAKLDRFANLRLGRRYWITLTCPEFSSLCPVTGQPDTANIVIRYIPGDHCVETKSLKFYLASFRNQAAFNEEVVNRILDDLVALMNPQQISVRGDFGSRGGIQLTTEATFPDSFAAES